MKTLGIIMFSVVMFHMTKNIWHVESPQHGSRVENRKIMKRINKLKCK